MRYTKYQIVRTKHIGISNNLGQPSGNSEIYELLFQHGRPGFAPGSMIKLHNTETWLYVASGIAEPWTRLLIDSQEIPMDSWGDCIKISETKCLYPELIEDGAPNFYCSGTGLALPLSYISTFPDRKVEIVYLGPAIHLEFLKQRSILKRSREEIDVHKDYYCKDGVKRNGTQIY